MTRHADDLPDEWYPSGEDRDELLDFYVDGACWYLALALQRRMGWPIVVLGRHEGSDDDWRNLSFDHAACLHPTGVLVDIEGARTPVDMVRRWGGSPIEVDADRFAQLCMIDFSPDGLRNADEVAIPFVEDRCPGLFDGHDMSGFDR